MCGQADSRQMERISLIKLFKSNTVVRNVYNVLTKCILVYTYIELLVFIRIF